MNNYTNKQLNQICRTVFLLLLGFGFQISNAQNSCATAVAVGPGTFVVGNIDGANLQSSCSTAGQAEWYIYTPTTNHRVTVTSDLNINICKDTNVTIYTGTCAGLGCYAEDDDNGVIACNVGNTNSYLSVVAFDAYAGVSYYIAWDNTWDSSGFSFQLSEAVLPPNPCGTAIGVSAGITTVPSINGVTISTACSTATLAKWYAYTPSQNANVTISSDLAANICKDTNFSVYTGSCSGGLICVASDDNSGIIACNVGNTNSYLSKATFAASSGTTYFIVWDNKNSAAGFNFQITEAVIVIPINYTSTTIGTINSAYNNCVVDMNNDGKDDLVGVSTNSLRLHTQGAAGVFTVTDIGVPGTSVMPSWSICAGDFNKDGFNDVVMGSGNGLSLWRSMGSNNSYVSETPGQYIFCQRTNFADINNDGNLDIFSCHDVAPNVYYINNGNAMTYYQSGMGGAYNLGVTSSGGNYASIWADFDNDGDSDMFISKCSGPPCELHRNDGAAGFTDISAQAQINFQPVSSWSSAINDFDNDGDMDIIVGSNGGVGTRFFRNNLDTTNTVEEAFSNITAGSGWDTSTNQNRDYISYDFDNDGYIDVLGGGNRIMFNQAGTGVFVGTTYPNVSVGAVGDLNDDGFLDILNGNTIKYAIPNGNNWVKVALHGVASNSNGIGARVEVYGPFGKKIRDVRSGEGFGYMSSLNAHFGLGTSSSITKVIVRWPSGAADIINFPSVNTTLNFVEGLNPLSTEEMTASNFSVYPNPANDVLNIKMGSALEKVMSAEIFDISGRRISESNVANGTVSVKELSVGTYILLINTKDGKRYSQKFLKN